MTFIDGDGYRIHTPNIQSHRIHAIMQKPKEVLDSYYLEARCQILEIAAMLDRYDRACGETSEIPDDHRINLMYDSLTMLSDRRSESDRSERLLNLFSYPE